jgi:hypothetical protein
MIDMNRVRNTVLYACACLTALAAGAAGGTFYYSHTHKGAQVPSFRGSNIRVVEDWAEKNRLSEQVLFTRDYDENADKDIVIAQSVPEGSFLKKDEIDQLLNPDSFVGRAPKQTEEYLNNVVYPRLKPYIESGKLMADEGLKV